MQNWDKTTQKTKELEHIIRKCDQPAAALSTLTQGAAVPSLYSHIAQSEDNEETEIPLPFKGVNPKQNKFKARGKVDNSKRKPPPVQIQEEQYTFEDTNNYYHTKNYRGQPRGQRPYRGQNT